MAKPTSSRDAVGLKHGFRSGLEVQTAAELDRDDVPYRYEDKQDVIRYEKPARVASYTPDFVLPNGTIVETKGRFVTADRQKHLLIKDQFPGKRICFLFQNPNARISKTSKTTYAMWCEKHGFEYAKAATAPQHKKGATSIPEEWTK